jgi:non-ribosomal peptide synthetase component E (peptide arylation enzyme)
MNGLMQDFPLTLDLILRRARDLGGQVEVVSPSSPTLDRLRAFLAERVTRWWLPDAVEVVDGLPKTGVGKYDKRRLRAEHANRLARR